jgi:hypothetical protein
MTEKQVLIIGGTGNLGKLVVSNLLANGGSHVRLVVRHGSASKIDEDVRTNKNVSIIELASGQELPEHAAFDGVFSVVSTVQGGPETIIGFQLKLVELAIKAGVRRFFTSSFSVNLNHVPGRNINLDFRRDFATQARKLAAGSSLEIIDTCNGCFLDRGTLQFLGLVDWEKKEIYQWVDAPGVQLEFTTLNDTARLVAAAAVTNRDVPQTISIAGDVLLFAQFVEIVNRVFNNAFTVKQLGHSVQDIQAEHDRRRSEQPNNIYYWLPLQYRLICETDGFTGNYTHDLIPDLQTNPLTTAEVYFRRE